MEASFIAMDTTGEGAAVRTGVGNRKMMIFVECEILWSVLEGCTALAASL